MLPDLLLSLHEKTAWNEQFAVLGNRDGTSVGSVISHKYWDKRTDPGDLNQTYNIILQTPGFPLFSTCADVKHWSFHFVS